MAERKPDRARPTKKAKFSSFFRSPLFKVLLSIFLFFFIGVSALVLYYYNYYSKVIDRRLSGEIFKNTAQIYAAPFRIYPGQKLAPDEVVLRLQRAGFDNVDKGGSEEGSFDAAKNRITIKPKVGDAMRLDFANASLTKIVKPGIGETAEAWLPAELVTNLYDQSREKRRLIEYNDLPKVFIDALTAAEDQHFFTHWGIDPVRLAGAVLHSVRSSDRIGGTSTITQQFARNFFLTTDRTVRRKVAEILITLMLEQRLTKQQILTLYVNQTYMGQRGSFSINGFGEAAEAYFGKDISNLTLPEAATLAGIIPAPNGKFSPVKHPDEVKRRRNTVLAAMHSIGTISDKEYEAAKNSDLKVVPPKVDASDAPYLVDYIRDELLKTFSEEEVTNGGLRVYTSLDPALQKIAVEAVQNGLKSVNDLFASQKKRQKENEGLPGPQASLIALDPHTGEIKAMVGGSDYGMTQLNRIVQASRQPGSIFKPIVYAAALETAFDKSKAEDAATAPDGQKPEPTITPTVENVTPVEGSKGESLSHDSVVTAITTITDEPTTFVYENGRSTYQPNNYHQEYRGLVTVRTALEHSLNVPTIKVAEHIGYDRVAAMAKRLGLNAKIKGYPSVALGAFEVTPIEMAGAYTAFANEGRRMQPHALLRVTSADGSTNKAYKYEPQDVIRPELAYLMTYLMEGVINSGTAAGPGGVRARGFMLPAAGKTGTSRDGWFAGYTKDLLVIAWVGYDDNRDLNLEGARSALPIWTEFMMKATALYPPKDPEHMNFDAPGGIQFERIDSDTLMLANSACENTFEEAFIEGTAPTTYCTLHGFHISDTLDKAIAEPAKDIGKDVGKGVGRVFQGIGKAFGGLFGGGDDKK
ncbi:MAG TPA: transglycosylase domain-containing protein [Terriglobia bacterium]|nr:transglycosylase domain-containing protein [Terriglobia bacterium]